MKIKSAGESLKKILQEAGASMYQQSGQGAGSGGAGAQGGAGGEQGAGSQGGADDGPSGYGAPKDDAKDADFKKA